MAEEDSIQEKEKLHYTIEPLTHSLLNESEGLFETYSCMVESPKLSLEKAQETLLHMHEQGSTIFVALSEEGKIIGAITMMIEHKLIRGGVKAGHIEDVVTHTFARGQGVARALIEKAIAYAKEEGCYKIVLDCCHNLKEFYEKNGFKEYGHFMRLDI